MWKGAEETIRQDYADHLRQLALVAAQQVDPQLHQNLRDPAQLNGPEYRQAVEPLRRMSLALQDVTSIYTMVHDGDRRAYFVLDTADPGDRDGDGIEDQAGIGEVFLGVDETTREALGDGLSMGRAAATRQPSIDKWGLWMTGMAPLVDASGKQFGIVGVDVDSRRFMAHLDQARFRSFIGLLPAAMLILALSIAYYRVRARGLAAELAAAHSAEALSIEQRRLANIILSTRIGTWESAIDPTMSGQDVITVDENWAAMLGRTAAELNPMTRARLFPMLVHPDDAAPMQEAVERALREDNWMFAVSVRLRHAAGRWIWAEVRGKVIARDAQGRPLRMVGTQLDIAGSRQSDLAAQ